MIWYWHQRGSANSDTKERVSDAIDRPVDGCQCRRNYCIQRRPTFHVLLLRPLSMQRQPFLLAIVNHGLCPGVDYVLHVGSGGRILVVICTKCRLNILTLIVPADRISSLLLLNQEAREVGQLFLEETPTGFRGVLAGVLEASWSPRSRKPGLLRMATAENKSLWSPWVHSQSGC
jgi:hypothetical protein